jgi:hypothetical protein
VAVLSLASTVIAGAAPTVSAAQVETLPSQQNIPLPLPPNPAPPLTNQNQPQGNESTIPQHLPGSQGQTRDIPLPQVFRGCWRGSVPSIDTLEPIEPEAARTVWLTKSYMLCYKQAGYNGQWQLTFAEGSVSDRRQVSDQRQAIKVKAVSGPDRAELTAYLHFRARPLTMFGMPGFGPSNTLDELTHLHCSVTPDKDAMDVRAAVFVENNNQPYANITWHTRFVRTTPDNGG